MSRIITSHKIGVLRGNQNGLDFQTCKDNFDLVDAVLRSAINEIGHGDIDNYKQYLIDYIGVLVDERKDGL